MMPYHYQSFAPGTYWTFFLLSSKALLSIKSLPFRCGPGPEAAAGGQRGTPEYFASKVKIIPRLEVLNTAYFHFFLFRKILSLTMRPMTTVCGSRGWTSPPTRSRACTACWPTTAPSATASWACRRARWWSSSRWAAGAGGMSGERQGANQRRHGTSCALFRVANYPDVEGWAPETYLERIPNR